MGLLIVAGIGYYLLNELFLSAYRTPVRVPATVYAVEMTGYLETLQDLLATGDGGGREAAQRIKDRYQERATALASFLDPLLNSRMSGYHERLWPIVERWMTGETLSESERSQARGDLAALRKIIVLAGQRVEKEALDERRAAAGLYARGVAVLFALPLLAAFVFPLVVRRWRKEAENGPSSDAVPGNGGDSEKVSGEREREQAREQVLVKRYRDMLDSLPAAIVAADTVSGRILFMNAAFRAWFAIPDNLIGEEIATVTTRISVALTEQGKMTFGDKTFWRDTVRVGETDIYFIRDISEQERLATRLVNSERLISIGEMASKVTHEIRNPLSTVKMNAEYIADHAASLSPDALSTAIGRIVREVARLEEITSRYMDMVRYRAEEEPTSLTEVHSALEDIAKFHAGEFSRRTITFEMESLPDAKVPLSLNSFREVMLNLLKNAWEELGSGGKVRVRVEADAHTVRIIVEDSGRGVPATEREKIFRNFYTTKPGGTGIGLSHSLKLVTEVRGTITVDDSPLGGARFTVTLPRVAGVS